jgi:hypothetical protein
VGATAGGGSGAVGGGTFFAQATNATFRMQNANAARRFAFCI